MKFLQILASSVILLYFTVAILLYFLQTRLIFFPGKLAPDFKFKLAEAGEEVMLKTADGESISALFCPGEREDVVLYFHGNAGDLSGWQHVAEDFVYNGFNILLIDYRGYGKSSGSISEQGFYNDAAAAFDYLVRKGFNEKNIIIYGRSIGTGVAVDIASKHAVKGLILEAPYTTLPDLADEKLPFLFPSLYLKFRFNNLKKIENVTSPVLLIHGDADEIIPVAHSRVLYSKLKGRKKLVVIAGGAHNDLNSFPEYSQLLSAELDELFR